MSTPLTTKQQRYLRALAHDLKPVVQVGTAGITRGVLEEIDRALETHELIKVRVSREAPLSTEEAVGPIEGGTRSQVAQVIGRTLVVYRRRAKEPKIQLPRAAAEK